MKKQIIYISLIVLTVFLESCSSMYIPATTNIPLLEEKGETQFELTATPNSLHLTGDYAFSNKYALMINSSMSYKNFTSYYDIFTHENDELTVSSSWVNLDFRELGEFAHRYIELGIGRYNIVQSNLKLEIFTGIGYGLAIDERYSKNYEANYYLGFVQANIGRSFKKVDFGGGLRLATSFYDYKFQISYSGDPYYNNGLPQSINFNMIHVEPIGFVRFGSERVKVVFRGGLALKFPLQSFGELDLYRGIQNGHINTTALLLAVGVNFKFGKTNK